MVTHQPHDVTVEEAVVDILKEAGLLRWQQQIVFGLQIRRAQHFSFHNDKVFKDMGMLPDEIKRLRSSVQSRRNLPSSNTVIVKTDRDSLTMAAEMNKSEITKEQIHLMETIGEGTFAVVKKAVWTPPNGQKINVAVKILRDVSPLVMEDLKVEAGHLLNLQHQHLIRLYGVVSQSPIMVFELCEGGSLLDRLRESNKPVLLLNTLLDYCLQIVKAMAYLESKHCVHRDLAARNILITKDEKNVKICDFGLMRNLKENEQMYIMGPQKRVPFSWCPPESLKQRKFSHASDVWAFGVTVWELFSYGEEPWIGCRALDVLKLLDKGERLKKPDYCSDQIYDIISLCWNVHPDRRPKFTQLKGFLQEAQFNMAEVRELHMDSGENAMSIQIGDKIIVTQNTGVIWKGQNLKTRKFGTFLRSCVFVHGKGLGSVSQSAASPNVPPTPKPPPTIQHPTRPLPPVPSHEDPGGISRFSLPIRGSFIHAGHGDIGGTSWGNPEKIDDIYLKNPILGQPMELGIPKVFGNHSSQPTRIAPPPPPAGGSGKPNSLTVRTTTDPLHPDWGDFDAAQSPSFSPSRIEIAPVNPPPLPKNVPKAVVPVSNGYPTSTGRKTDAHHSAREVWSSSAFTNGMASSSLIIPTQSGTASINMPSKSISSHQPPLVSEQTAANISSGSIQFTSKSSSSSFGNVTTRIPPTLHSIPRPGGEVRRNENRTPPTINPNSFIASSSSASTSSSSDSHSITRRTTISGQGVNKNVLEELNRKFKPSEGTQPYVSNHNVQQNFVSFTPSGITVSPSKDPFNVPDKSYPTSQKQSKNDIIQEQRLLKQLQLLNQHQPHMVPQVTPLSASLQTPRPHSTTGVPQSSISSSVGNPQSFGIPLTSQIPCLTPTPLPPQMPILTQNTPSFTPQLQSNPTLSSTTPRSQTINRGTPNAPVSSGFPNASFVTPTASMTLPPGYNHRSQAENASLDNSSLKNMNTSTVVRPPSEAAPQGNPKPKQQSVSMGTSGTNSVKPNSTHPSATANTMKNQNNSSTSVGNVTMRTGTNNHRESAEDRKSRIEEEVLNRLGAPSPLLLGDKNKTSSVVSASSEPSLHKAASTPALPRQPTPNSGVGYSATTATMSRMTKPVDPLPISLNSVLEPTRLPVNYNVPATPLVDRTVEISNIMNAYNYSPYLPLAQPHPTQVPLFALNNSQYNIHSQNNVRTPNAYPLAITNTPYIPTNNTPSTPSIFRVGSAEDVLDALDPFRNSQPSIAPSSGSETTRSNGIGRAHEMEVLYREAPFAPHSKCDEMVNVCKGDIEAALKELKMEHLMECFVISDKGKAFDVLDRTGWDLNRAAEMLFA
ncbi:unnamed protein product [Auanema sp. JU1783]|nr:unnamed protein product [Auanema sp. JU1783]